MKRGKPLERSDGLSRGKPMARTAWERSAARDALLLQREAQLVRQRRRLPYRSAKTADVYARPGGRRDLVAELLAAFPVCQARVVCQGARSSEVHEVKTRARGGSILDRENCLALCHACHSWVTTNPIQAHRLGLMKQSWE